MDIFLDSIDKKLKKISLPLQVLFSALTCEKLLPNYVAFSNDTNWGNADILEEIIMLQYQFVQGYQIKESELVELSTLVEVYTPDLDEFKNNFASYAFDCCIAFDEAIQHLITKKYINVLNVASNARNTVDMFVQVKENLDPDDPNLDMKISQDSFMLREIKRQEMVLDILIKNPEINDTFIKDIRDLNKQTGMIVDLKILN